MKEAKTLYWIVLGIVFGAFCLFEYQLLPVDLIPPSPTTGYALNLLSIVTAIGGCFALLYCFRIGKISARYEAEGEAFAIRVIKTRLYLWVVLMIVNIVLYYEARFVTDAKYGILILFVAIIFCWPALPKTEKERAQHKEESK